MIAVKKTETVPVPAEFFCKITTHLNASLYYPIKNPESSIPILQSTDRQNAAGVDYNLELNDSEQATGKNFIALKASFFYRCVFYSGASLYKRLNLICRTL